MAKVKPKRKLSMPFLRLRVQKRAWVRYRLYYTLPAYEKINFILAKFYFPIRENIRAKTGNINALYIYIYYNIDGINNAGFL